MVVNKVTRAKQFLPFDALKGLKEALKEKELEVETEYEEKTDKYNLSDEWEIRCSTSRK